MSRASVLSQKFVRTCSRARESSGERQPMLIRPKSHDFGYSRGVDLSPNA